MSKLKTTQLVSAAAFGVGLVLSMTTPAAADDPRLGRVWREVEGNVWEGSWTRRGVSNVFDAEWHRTYGPPEVHTGVITMDFTGQPGTVNQDIILIHREDDNGGRCNYVGHFSSAANHDSAGGTYSCVGGGSGQWAASVVAR